MHAWRREETGPRALSSQTGSTGARSELQQAQREASTAFSQPTAIGEFSNWRPPARHAEKSKSSPAGNSPFASQMRGVLLSRRTPVIETKTDCDDLPQIRSTRRNWTIQSPGKAKV